MFVLCVLQMRRKCVYTVNVNTDPEVVSGRDGRLAHVPVVAGVPGEAPDLPVLGPGPDIHIERAHPVTKHVGPEPETQRTTGILVNPDIIVMTCYTDIRSHLDCGGELLGHEERLVAGPPGVTSVDVGEGAGHAVGGEAGVIPLGPRVRIITATALQLNIHDWI